MKKLLQFRQIQHSMCIDSDGLHQEELYGIDNTGNIYRYDFDKGVWDKFPCETSE